MRPTTRSHARYLALAALIGVTALAALLRLYRLDAIPPALFFDEAGQGVDSLNILNGELAIFFQRSITKEPLYVYWTVPFVALLERGPWAVRLPAALVGIATVPVTAFLVRELLMEEAGSRARWIALLAAGLLAGSFWAVLVNRMAFRVNTVPLFTALAMALIWRTYRKGGTILAVAAGFSLGICFYTYLSARFVYLLALLILGLLALSAFGRKRLWERRRELLAIGVTCVIVMLPLGLYFAAHPEDFLRRATMVTVGSQELTQQSFGSLLVRSVLGHLGMFGGPGDPELRHNIPHRSILAPWLALLFWLGFGLAAWRIRRPGRMVAVLWFVVLLLPAILSVSDPRHMLRAFSVLPVVYFFPALAFHDTLGWLERRISVGYRGWLRLGAAILALTMVIGQAVATAQAYFVQWAGEPGLPRAFRAADTAIAAEINAAPDGVSYIVPLAPLWRGLDGNYTLEYLVEKPARLLTYYPDAPDAAEQVAAFLSGGNAHEVRVVHYTWGQDAAADPYNLTHLLLDQVGTPLTSREEADFRVDAYVIPVDAAPLVLPAAAQDAGVIFSSEGREVLRLDAWRLPAAAPEQPHLASGGHIPVGLEWQQLRPLDADLQLSLRLIDSLGKPVGQQDGLLAQGTQIPGALSTYHVLAAAPGTPPGSYAVQIIAYDAAVGRRLAILQPDSEVGDQVLLGTVRVGPPAAGTEPYEPAGTLPRPEPNSVVSLATGLDLVAIEAFDRDAVPGLPLEMTLAWRVIEAGRPQTLSMALGEQVVGEINPDLPRGGPWRTSHRLILPQNLAPGSYPLRLGVPGASSGDGSWIHLGAVSVQELPAGGIALDEEFRNGIRLAGWAVSPKDEGLEIWLTWRRGERAVPQDYVVFVHLLDADGNIIAQHDAQPHNGRYPTGAWPDAVAVPDRHVLAAPAQAEGACVRVGLYLPGSQIRLPLADGRDSVVLPMEDGAEQCLD